MTGQADSAPSLDDVASFLVDNPEADSNGNEPLDDESPDADGGADKPDSNDDPDADPEADPEQPDEGEEPEEDDDAPNARQGLKFKVPVKGADGADTTIEVDEKELIAGFMRRQDHTRKTQELAQKEAEASSTFETRMKEGREHLVREIVKVRQVVNKLAALKDDAELAQLAATNPQEYSAEFARKQAIMAAMREVDETMQGVEEQWRQQQAENDAKARSTAWLALGKMGINKEGLGKIFETVSKQYDIPMSDFANVKNPKVVQIMRDAARYHEALGKSQALKAKAKQASQPKTPQLPAARQQQPAARSASRKALDKKFASGNAGVKDLARIL